MIPEWENRVLEKYGTPALLVERELNELGKEGWEVAGIGAQANRQTIYLKRPKGSAVSNGHQGGGV